MTKVTSIATPKANARALIEGIFQDFRARPATVSTRVECGECHGHGTIMLAPHNITVCRECGGEGYFEQEDES